MAANSSWERMKLCSWILILRISILSFMAKKECACVSSIFNSENLRIILTAEIKLSWSCFTAYWRLLYYWHAHTQATFGNYYSNFRKCQTRTKSILLRKTCFLHGSGGKYRLAKAGKKTFILDTGLYWSFRKIMRIS